jgi:nitrite reductase/ring-hydroxylating ferredoxin subunit
MDELFVICRTVEIDDAQAHGFVLMKAEESGEASPWPIIVTRKGNNFYGFENSCPHEGLRLDKEPGQFMDEEGNFLECGRHRAQFDIDTGECFIGPCQGASLTPIKLVIDEGDVCVTGVMLADE